MKLIVTEITPKKIKSNKNYLTKPKLKLRKWLEMKREPGMKPDLDIKSCAKKYHNQNEIQKIKKTHSRQNIKFQIKNSDLNLFQLDYTNTKCI